MESFELFHIIIVITTPSFPSPLPFLPVFRWVYLGPGIFKWLQLIISGLFIYEI